jgi:hypothetical protein
METYLDFIQVLECIVVGYFILQLRKRTYLLAELFRKELNELGN